MKKVGLAIAMAGSVLFAAQSASAATRVTDCNSGASCTIAFDGTSGTYGNANVTNQNFFDRYIFDLGDGLLSLMLTTTFSGADGGAQDIDFSVVRLNPPGTASNVNIPMVPTTDETYSLRNYAVSAGQYALRLEGSGASNLNASYAGTINFSATPAVPEPATWGMMILGFGVVGYAMRRGMRRSNEKFDAKIKRITYGTAA